MVEQEAKKAGTQGTYVLAVDCIQLVYLIARFMGMATKRANTATPALQASFFLPEIYTKRNAVP